jgi:Lipocalin-like domain
MRPAIAFAVTLILLACQPAAADEDLAVKLVGSWRVVSLKLTYLNENTEQEVLGANPIGRIIYSADHHFAAFVSRRDRKPAQTDADAAALLSSMVAYTGTFRIEGDRAIYTVDGAWNEVFPREQLRILQLDGDTLTATAPEPQPSTFFPGKRFIGVTVFVREHAP